MKVKIRNPTRIGVIKAKIKEMEKNMNRITLKAATIFSLLTIVAAFFVPTISYAATVNWTKIADYVSTWHIKSMNGLHWTDEGVHMIKADNEPAFCIEHGVLLNGGTGFSPSELNGSERERLSLIAYYGYQIDPTPINYGITQNVIWQEYGDELLSTQLPNYEQKKAEILAKVAKHTAKPSFQDQTVELKVGESITLTDTANVLANYQHLLTNSANLKVEKNGNQLVLTATKDSKETGKLQYGIAGSEHIGQSFVYSKGNEQKVATFRLNNAGEMNVNIKVNLNGNIQVKKVDEDTGKPVPNTKMKLEYDGKTTEVTTDNNGLAALNDLKAGIKVKISEVQANDGYVNRGEVKEVTVEPNKTIEVVFGNKAQQGLLHLKKTGQKAVSVNEQKSDYGTLYQLSFDYVPLADVTFDIRAVEDIKVGDHIHAKAGTVVATVKTNDQGDLVDMPRLYLGKYEAIEKSAPNGFILNNQPNPFEFTYGGQEIELVSHSIEVKNDFQKLTIVVHKNEEQIQGWENNQPILEAIPANNKVFGLFTNQEFTVTDGTKLPADSLLAFEDVQEGNLSFEQLHLPQGAFYVKELHAGDNHQLDENHYEFEFSVTDHEQEKTIEVSKTIEDGQFEPLLNKLHFNQFALKKINEEAKLAEKEGYEFTLTGNGQGAVFILENENKEIIQEVTVDENSIATFETIPVGTFYLEEKKATSDQYVLSTETYTVLSTKEGIEIFSSEGELMGSTISKEDTEDVESNGNDEEEPTPMSVHEENKEENDNPEVVVTFEVKNYLVKGNAELTKKDVTTGEVLPNTSIQILDEDKKIVVERQTNDQGVFSFEKLPKGTYYFKEFAAPEGYQLDETPIKFEIKEDGVIVKCEMTNKLKETGKYVPKKETGRLPQTGEINSSLFTVLGVSVLAVAGGCYYWMKKKGKIK
ncbi:SpaA isopeptide-forming pilin-related protein [Enterococcus faecalis]|uniref:SpaA isopeptide-forming pilin-related protein n=1 Tax=Enterococcus faecalis TaxID=1351 RepID=UPI0001F0DA5F|nr:SpaA isopeptide-forming pilin-related protein [Enterococcus faecalis]EFT95163.1 LPXTG-motif cell wall anchor domain protein [Enterococcus faecalis TX0012]